MNTLHWEGYIRFGIYAAKKIKFMMGKQVSVDHCPWSLNGSDQDVGILIVFFIFIYLCNTQLLRHALAFLLLNWLSGVYFLHNCINLHIFVALILKMLRCISWFFAHIFSVKICKNLTGHFRLDVLHDYLGALIYSKSRNVRRAEF